MTASRVDRRRASSSATRGRLVDTEGLDNGNHEDRRHGRCAAETWPHWLSPTLACVSCSLNAFNISRFSVLACYYGPSFLAQFCLLSVCIGLPMISFFLGAGQALSAGAMSMWRVCPIFRGVGFGLLFAQVLLGVTQSGPVTWLFAYLRDSFLLAWGECNPNFRGCPPLSARNPAKPVADYFHGKILGQNFSESTMPFSMVFSNIKFEPAFHLAILWMAVLLVFSKGLRSYGKTVYFVVLIPIVTLCLVCGQLIATGRQQGFLFLESYAGFSWLEGLQNPEQWVAVSREVFFVWGLNGCAVMQMASHNRRNRRIAGEAVFVAVLVLAPLLLASFACGSCLHILAQAGFRYVPSSFETHRTFDFLRNRNSVDGDWNATVSSLFFGAVFSPPHVMFTSGYAPLQFATEIFPAATLVLGSVALSPFWSMLFYFSMTALGFAALLVTWKTVVEMIVSLKPSFLKKWEVTVAFLGCSSALVFSLLYASGVGIHALYFMDNCLGSGWWIMVLYVLLLLGLLCVRGKPYSGENIASVFLFPSKESCGARTVQIFLAFLWTVILPTVLLVTAVISFAHGTFRQMLNWELVEEPFVAWEKLDTTFSDDTEAPEPINSKFYMHWSDLARHLGGWIQVAPLLAVPLVASIQCIWYLSCGPSNVIERMMKLCRPSLSMDSNNGRHSDERHSFHCHQCQQQGHQNNMGLFDEHSEVGDAPEVVEADVPPKYTPPPSYSTATGTMLAKFLRRSFRHSLQHIQGLLHSSSSSPRGSVDATSAAAAATAATNGGFVISDDPAGNDSSSDGPPRETHYTLRAAERRRSNSHRTHTPPPDYNDLTSSDSFRSLGSSTSSTSTSSSTAAAGSFRLLRALQRTLSQRSRGMIMRMDNDDDEEVAATVGEDQQQQHRGRLGPSSAGATELVSVSTIDLESIDSTDA